MQYRGKIWCPIDTFFEKERGRTIKNSHVNEILSRFHKKLEERQNQLDNDEDGILLDIVLSTLDPPKSSSRPSIFTDVKIYAEGTAPGLANCFLATNDSHFTDVVANVAMEELFILSVQETLGVVVVPKIQ